MTEDNFQQFALDTHWGLLLILAQKLKAVADLEESRKFKKFFGSCPLIYTVRITTNYSIAKTTGYITILSYEEGLYFLLVSRVIDSDHF